MEKPTLLIIEDNADTRKFLEAMLSKEFHVLCAENAILGIELARNKCPDLLVCHQGRQNVEGENTKLRKGTRVVHR